MSTQATHDKQGHAPIYEYSVTLLHRKSRPYRPKMSNELHVVYCSPCRLRARSSRLVNEPTALFFQEMTFTRRRHYQLSVITYTICRLRSTTDHSLINNRPVGKYKAGRCVKLRVDAAHAVSVKQPPPFPPIPRQNLRSRRAVCIKPKDVQTSCHGRQHQA